MHLWLGLLWFRSTNDFFKGTGFCISTFTKFDNFESCLLLASRGDGFFFEILMTHGPPFLAYTDFMV